ncbi:Superoxide dismutase [Fe] [Candidatus Hepatincolaceae symbiont of Richtersius coronifer]
MICLQKQQSNIGKMLMKFTLPPLPYEKNALEPFMSAETLELHHDKHHQTYVEKLNTLLENHPLKDKFLQEIIVQTYEKKGDESIFNNAGQHYNHIEFWPSLKNNPKGQPSAFVKQILEKDFGSFESFKEAMIKNGMEVFGSGWVYLAKNSDNKLEILRCSNAVNPIALGKKTVLGCDVWEHSYYVDFRNKRADYLKSWIDNLINWDYVEKNLKA